MFIGYFINIYFNNIEMIIYPKNIISQQKNYKYDWIMKYFIDIIRWKIVCKKYECGSPIRVLSSVIG